MRFVVISEKDEVLRISHAVMSELFDRKLALPQFARKRIRWCEVIVSLQAVSEDRPSAIPTKQPFESTFSPLAGRFTKSNAQLCGGKSEHFWIALFFCIRSSSLMALGG